MKTRNLWFVYCKRTRRHWTFCKEFRSAKAAERFVERNQDKLGDVICISDQRI